MTAEQYGQAELMILGLLLTTHEAKSQAYLMQALQNAGVTAEWFRATNERKLFEGCAECWKKHQNLDTFLILQECKSLDLENAQQVICDTIDSCTSGTIANLEFYIRALKDKHIYSSAHRLITETLKEMHPDNIGTTLEDFVQKIHRLQEFCAAGESDLKQIGDYMAQSMEKKWLLHEERFVKHNWAYLDGLPWPWKEVDQIFTGLKKGLHIVAALASQGKSTMAVNLSVFWNERGIKHGFFSIDMAADQLADRYPCVVNRVSLAKLNFGASSEEVRRFEAGYRHSIKLNNVWISEIDDAKTLEYQCYRGVKTLGWKAIIIDYIQLVHVEDKGNLPEYTRVQRAVQAVKSIAKKLEVPIICLAQLSRAFEQQLREKGFAPGLDAIGDSAEIARAAASVTCLYRDEEMSKYWEETPPVKLGFADPNDAAYTYGVTSLREEDEETSISRRAGQKNLARMLRPIWFDVKKNQQGRCGKIPFVLFPNYFLFRPGNSDGEKSSVKVGGKEKMLPTGQFEQLRDDWTYTEQDWWYEMTGVMPQRGAKLAGETVEQMRERIAREREAHPEVRHFVKHPDGSWEFVEAMKTTQQEVNE